MIAEIASVGPSTPTMSIASVVGALYAFVPVITLHDVAPAQQGCARNKTLHLIRHAEGWHNVDELEAEAAFTAGAASWHGLNLRDPANVKLRDDYGIAWTLLKQVSGDKYHDPHLTPKGRDQCYALRTQLRANPAFAVDAVAVSPMRRAIETALLGLPQLEAASTAFAWSHDDDPPRPPPVLATDLLRERCAHFMPDSRLTRTQLTAEFGTLGAGARIDLSQIDEQDTPFLDGKERHEPETGSPLLAARAAEALKWLAALPEAHRHVAVVSHKHFLGALTALHADGGVEQRPFSNAERRTVLMCIGAGDELAAEAEQDGGTVKPVRARVKPVGGSG